MVSKPTVLTCVDAMWSQAYLFVCIAVSVEPGSQPDTNSGCLLHIY